MITAIRKILGIGPKVDYAQLVKEGASIIDVRTPAEYKQGHIHGSVNIPLTNLKNNFFKINKEKPVITCCASGMRSASAKSILRSHGFKNVFNGGRWMSLKARI